MEIAGNNVTNMTHRDALDLIQRCANALFITVHKYIYLKNFFIVISNLSITLESAIHIHQVELHHVPLP